MGTPESSREPCPDRILDLTSRSFGMGAIGGSAFHFLKGIYHSPRGRRFIGGTEAVLMHAPRVAGSCAVLGGLLSAFECTMVYVRQKEDYWNSIISGAATGGILAMRQGLVPAARSAAMGGVLLAMIEGARFKLNKFVSSQPMPPVMIEDAASASPESTTSKSGWFEEVKPSVQTEVLESFDSPMPPTFESNLNDDEFDTANF